MARKRKDDHPNPHIDVPMRVFGDLFFGSRYELIGQFVHAWCHAVWKNDPKFFYPELDEDDLRLAESCGWLIKTKDGYRLTGPKKAVKWLLVEDKWQTYAIEAVGESRVKLGKTTDLSRRINALQCGMPHEVKVIALFPGDIESDLHDRFADRRLRGEWFALDDDLRKQLRDLETRMNGGRLG